MAGRPGPSSTEPAGDAAWAEKAGGSAGAARAPWGSGWGRERAGGFALTVRVVATPDDPGFSGGLSHPHPAPASAVGLTESQATFRPGPEQLQVHLLQHQRDVFLGLPHLRE